MMEIEEGIGLFEKEIAVKTVCITVSLEEADGKVLAEDVRADFSVPHFPKSAMDGYAVKPSEVEGASKEHPVNLKVLCQLCAGDYTEKEYEPGTAVRVMTGSYVPKGYTAVIRQEDTDYGEDEVRIYSSVKEYQNYCKVGEDVPEGTVVLEKGTFIRAVHIGLLASLGIQDVKVIEPLRVAIISTGSELLEAGERLWPGRIYNSIAPMLSAAVRRAGFTLVSSKICEDEEKALMLAIQQAAESADVIISTGGVSVGKKDFLPKVLEELGAKVLFRRANIQPGTPTMGSMLGRTAVLSLSGNPYAAMANFEIYFWNIAGCFMNCTAWHPKTEKVILGSEYPKVNRLRRFVRAYAANGQVRIPTDVHSSSVLSSMTKCNCFIDIEAGRQLRIGDLVTVRYYDFI